MNIDNEMKAAILHDTHKIFMVKHDNAFTYFFNGEVKNIKPAKLSTSADRDAERLSRHNKAIDKMNGNYLNKSFIEDKNNIEKNRVSFRNRFINEYLESKESTEILHNKLLCDNILSNFNEITSMPFTSLKYHTLLVCALHFNYIINRDFKDLYFNYTNECTEQYSIIFRYNEHCLTINDDNNGARIGYKPTTNFGDTMGRINDIPLPEFLIDNLRRIRSWSIGLQYLEDAMEKLVNKKTQASITEKIAIKQTLTETKNFIKSDFDIEKLLA